MPALDPFLDNATKFGLPTFLLLALLYILIRVIRWTGEHVVLPVVTKHIETMDVISESIGKLTESQQKQAEAADRLSRTQNQLAETQKQLSDAQQKIASSMIQVCRYKPEVIKP